MNRIDYEWTGIDVHLPCDYPKTLSSHVIRRHKKKYLVYFPLMRQFNVLYSGRQFLRPHYQNVECFSLLQ